LVNIRLVAVRAGSRVCLAQGRVFTDSGRPNVAFDKDGFDAFCREPGA
jgi:hypothetical protein